MVYREPAEIKKEVEFKKPWYWLFGNKYTFECDDGTIYKFHFIRKKYFNINGVRQKLFETTNKNYVFAFKCGHKSLMYHSNSCEDFIESINKDVDFLNLKVSTRLKFKNYFESFFKKEIKLSGIEFYEL